MTEKDHDLAELNELFDSSYERDYGRLICSEALQNSGEVAKRSHDRYQATLALLKTLKKEPFKWASVINTVDKSGNLNTKVDHFLYTLEVVSFANQKTYLTHDQESDEIAKQYNLPNISSHYFLNLAVELEAETIEELEIYLSTHTEQRDKFFDEITSLQLQFFDFKESEIFAEFYDWYQVRLEQKRLDRLISTQAEKKKPTHKI